MPEALSTTRSADLEVGLHRRDEQHYTIEMRFVRPDSDADIRLLDGDPAITRFDFDHLRRLTLRAADYGRSLSDSLFADPSVLQAFNQASTIAQALDVPLRVRLYIGPTAPELHDLYWETLLQASEQTALMTSQRVLFSRYLSSSNERPLRLSNRDELRGLVVIANPADLTDYEPGGQRLTPFDVAGELQRARDGLGDIPLTIVTERGQVTLSTIMQHLRDGYDILYLVVHGALIQGEPYLWMENEQGQAAVVSGREFVQRFTEEIECPRLIVLASCQSAGNGIDGSLKALSPQLAQIGVPAVLAMQGNISVETVEQFMPIFFHELRRDGQIDRAMAAARSVIRERRDWWMPTLFMRLRNGLLWDQRPPMSDGQSAREGLTALAELVQSPIVHRAVVAFSTDFQAARVQIEMIGTYKDLHDLLHTLEFQCYNGIVQEARRFPDDETALDILIDHSLTLQRIVRDIRDVTARADLAGQEIAWVSDLDRAKATLQTAIDEEERRALKRTIWLINRVLAIQPTQINTRLNTAVRALRLPDLVRALMAIRNQVDQPGLDEEKAGQFRNGVAALSRLDEHLSRLVDEHDQWQAVDLELRRIEANLEQDLFELEMSWPDLKAMLELLYTDSTEEWAELFRSDSAKLDAAITQENPSKIRRTFRSYRRRAGHQFYRVDVELKRLCGDLREIGEPLTFVLQIITS